MIMSSANRKFVGSTSKDLKYFVVFASAILLISYLLSIPRNREPDPSTQKWNELFEGNHYDNIFSNTWY